MKNIFILVITTSLFFLCSIPPKYILQYPGWIKENKQRYLELENKIAANPNDIKSLLEQGSILDNMAFYDSALVKYERILEINPNYAPVYNNLGNTYVSLKKNQEALKYFEKAIQLDSTHALTYLNLGGLYGHFGNKERQLWCYKNAVKYDGNNPLHYYNLACYYSIENDLNSSLANLEIALEKGFNWIDHMKRDVDLNNLKRTDGYKNLLDKFRI